MLDTIYHVMTSGSTLGLFLQVVPITLLVGVVYILLRWRWLKKRRLPVDWPSEVFRWLFVCYLTGLCNLVLVPANLWSRIWYFLRNGYGTWDLDPPFSGGVNLVPMLFKCLAGEVTVGRWVREMLMGNLLMFLPLGFFLPFVTKKVNGRNIWIVAAVIPAAVEAIQFIIGRGVDMDDLLANFAGILLGFLAASAIKKLANRKNPRAQ